MATLKAVEHLVAAGGPPITLRFLCEGEEEITGESLPRYLRANGAKLKTDAVGVWDRTPDEEANPTLATALRGLLYLELHAQGAAVDLHSGTFGGVAPNPINTLARITGEPKDRHGHITVPGFYDQVKPPSPEELAMWERKEEGYVEALLKASGARALEGEPGFLALERTGSRPTLDANGFVGGFTGGGKKTAIPAPPSAKVRLRLCARQNPAAPTPALATREKPLSAPRVGVQGALRRNRPPAPSA